MGDGVERRTQGDQWETLHRPQEDFLRNMVGMECDLEEPVEYDYTRYQRVLGCTCADDYFLGGTWYTPEKEAIESQILSGLVHISTLLTHKVIDKDLWVEELYRCTLVHVRSTETI